MRSHVAVLLLWLCTASAAAQELTIFDLNDFVDPRTLGAIATSKGNFLCPCTDMLISRAIVGWDHNYVNVTDPSSIDVAFAHAATSYYRGPLQVNAKLTALRNVDTPSNMSRFSIARAVPKHAFAFQIGYYTGGGVDERTVIGRTQFTWRITHYAEPRRTVEQGTWTADKLRHEFGLEWDIPSRYGSRGSLTYTLIGGENDRLFLEKMPSRLAYVYRLREIPIGPVNVESGASVGFLGNALNFGHFRELTIQPAIRMAYPIRDSGVSLSVRIAPTFLREAKSADGNHHWRYTPEVAVFLDRVIFVPRTWLRGPKAAPTPNP